MCCNFICLSWGEDGGGWVFRAAGCGLRVAGQGLRVRDSFGRGIGYHAYHVHICCF